MTVSEDPQSYGDGPRLGRPAVALGFGLGTAVLLIAGLPLAAATRQLLGGGVVEAVILLPFAAVGWIVARRQPSNPIGWLMLAMAFFPALASDAGYDALLVYRFGHSGLPAPRLAVAVASLGFLAILLLMPVVIVLFPDGDLPSRRWRWPFVGYFGVWSVVLASEAVTGLTWIATGEKTTIDSSGGLQKLDHPTGWFGYVIGVASPLYGLFGLAFIVAQVLAYRRAQGVRRQQLKLLMVGGAAVIAGLTFDIVAPSGSSSEAVNVLELVGYVGIVAVPVSIGVGILRYRLYDVDRLISRTLSYALLTGALIGVFFGIVLVATRVLPFSSPVAVAASTLAAAALFNPLRGRLQRLVDRRFNRARYDAEAIVAGFSLQLRGAVDLEAVNDELLDAVGRAIEPAHASLWIRPT